MTPSDLKRLQNLFNDENRITQLARPKPLPSKFIEDRRSVYWVDGPIRKNGINNLSYRQNELAVAKLPHVRYQGDRPSPIWKVSPKAIRYKVSNRVESLSCPKLPHAQWMTDKPVQTVLKKRTLVALPSNRIIEMSLPKKADRRYVDPTLSDTQLDILLRIADRDEGIELEEQAPPAWIERLSDAKATPKGYQKDRPVMWTIERKTLKAQISERVDALSKIVRPGKRLDEPNRNDVEDPYAVSRGAMKAAATQRVSDLSAPIPRKMRQKK